MLLAAFRPSLDGGVDTSGVPLVRRVRLVSSASMTGLELRERRLRVQAV